MSRRTHSYNAYESPLSTGVGNSGSVIVDDPTNLEADCYLVIDPEDAGVREYVKVTAINYGTGELTCLRGEAGSVGGTAHAHDIDAPVRAVAVHQWLDDIFDDIEDGETWETEHLNATNPHPVYLTQDEGDIRYVEIAGDTMTGPLILAGAPSVELEASTKLYVDTAEADAKSYADAADVVTLDAANSYTDTEIANAAYLPLTGGTVTGSVLVTGNVTVESQLNIGAASSAFLLIDESPPNVFRMYVTNGPGTGTRYGLQMFGSGNDILDVSHDGHVFTTGIINDTDVMFRNMTNGGSQPANPVKGWYWVDTTANALKVWTGAAWVIILQGV